MIELNLILKDKITGGNSADVLQYLSNNSNKYLINDENTIRFDFINEKNIASTKTTKKTPRDGEEDKYANCNFYANGGNAVVFYIKDKEQQEYLIKIMKYSNLNIDEYLKYFNFKYNNDITQYPLNIPKLYYYGKISKDGKEYENYYYYITKIYATNFKILNFQYKINLLYDLLLLLKKTYDNEFFINDLKIANIGYLENNIILIDYDINTIHSVLTNNLNNGTYYPYYAMKEMYDKILITYDLVNKKCLDDKRKHLKIPVIGLLDIIFYLFYKQDSHKSLLSYLYSGGNYNGIELQHCIKENCNKYYEAYQNLKNLELLNTFVNKVNEKSRLYDNNELYLVLKNMILGDINGLLHTEYNNIITFDGCIYLLKPFIISISTPIKNSIIPVDTPPTQIVDDVKTQSPILPSPILPSPILPRTRLSFTIKNIDYKK